MDQRKWEMENGEWSLCRKIKYRALACAIFERLITAVNVRPVFCDQGASELLTCHKSLLIVTQ